MDDVFNKLTDQIKNELPGETEARKNALEETKKNGNTICTFKFK